MRLRDKVALITGAGSGIGRATAVLFAEHGARVAVADQNPSAGRETLDLIREVGNEAIFVEAEVSRAGAVQGLMATVIERFGRLDVLYNNAGILMVDKDAPITELEEDVWDKVFAVNLKGTYLCCKYGMPLLIEAGGGSIINTSSISALRGGSKMHAYIAAKGGVIALTRAIAVSYASRQVRANAICPGTTDTALAASFWKSEADRKAAINGIPLGKMADGRDIGNLALYLASDESSYVTGGVFVIDGGVAARW